MDRPNSNVAAGIFFAFLAIAIGACAYLCAMPRQKPPPPPREPTKPLSARDAGKAVGHTAHQFGKGIIEGWRDAKGDE